jgi:hypothetical protein
MNAPTSSTVIPGLVPGIYVSKPRKDVDGRNRCGHDVHRASDMCSDGSAR